MELLLCYIPKRITAARVLESHKRVPLFSNPLESRRHRLKMLHQRLAEAELRASMAQPIPTLHVRTCSHPECGAKRPQNPPADLLIINLGCKYAVPGTSTEKEE